MRRSTGSSRTSGARTGRGRVGLGAGAKACALRLELSERRFSSFAGGSLQLQVSTEGVDPR